MYTSILFAVDLEHESSWTTALPVVKELARTFGCRVHVVTAVLEVRSIPGAQHFPADFEKNIVEHARSQLVAFLETQMSEMKDVDTHVEIGSPYKQIVKAAEELGCDLIVMASHRPEMLDMLIGPNADNVVRHSKKSVLIVRE